MRSAQILRFCAFLVIATISRADEPPISTPVTITDSNPAAIAGAKKKGAANARRDIAAGRFRIVFLMEGSVIIGPLGYFDPKTGYPRYPMDGCIAGKAFLAEVEAYNRVMTKWHANHKH